MIYKISRFLIMLFSGVGAFTLCNTLIGPGVQWPIEIRWAVVVLGAIIGGLLGFAIAPWIIKQVIQFTSWVEG